LTDKPPPKASPSVFKRILRIAVFVAALYAFLLSIEMISGSLKLLGMPFAEALIKMTSNPVIGLFIGILVTALIQSSSATTSLVVSFVAAQTITGASLLPVEHAIPIIMGANIGTTVTNVIVSLFHISRKDEFIRAFPAATLHDMFNILSVIVFFTIEVFFHPIGYVSGKLAQWFAGVGGFKVVSPLAFVVKPVARAIIHLLGSRFYFTLPVAALLLFGGLRFMVDGMRKLVGSRTEVFIDRYLFGGPVRAFLVGLTITAAIQSSSVTTSFAVPLAGAGLLTLDQLFPYVLGANIGTTVTAILASLVTGSPLAIQVAFAHLLFNIFGTALWYPLKIVPLSLARLLGKIVSKRRWFALVYLAVVFVIIPVGLILLLRR
jgi:sodium-dependent phosphate cotransporter